MTLLIENVGYAFSIRFDLMFLCHYEKSLNNLSIKHLIKLILYENDLKLLKFERSPV